MRTLLIHVGFAHNPVVNSLRILQVLLWFKIGGFILPLIMNVFHSYHIMVFQIYELYLSRKLYFRETNNNHFKSSFWIRHLKEIIRFGKRTLENKFYVY